MDKGAGWMMRVAPDSLWWWSSSRKPPACWPPFAFISVFFSLFSLSRCSMNKYRAGISVGIGWRSWWPTVKGALYSRARDGTRLKPQHGSFLEHVLLFGWVERGKKIKNINLGQTEDHSLPSLFFSLCRVCLEKLLTKSSQKCFASYTIFYTYIGTFLY